jgi:hypothetical protein
MEAFFKCIQGMMGWCRLEYARSDLSEVNASGE